MSGVRQMKYQVIVNPEYQGAHKNVRVKWSKESRYSMKYGLSLFIPALSIAVFFLPANYAVSGRVYTIWQSIAAIVSIYYILVYVTRCRITLRWVLASLFFVQYYLISSILSRADGSIISDLFFTGLSIGFISMIEFGLNKDRELWVLAFVVGGSLLCAVHYYTYLRYGNVIGGMRSGYVEYRYGHATTQHWFFFTHDNGSLFYFLPVLACTWYYAITKHSRRMLLYACLLSAVTELMYIKLWSVSAMVTIALFLVATLYIIIRSPHRYIFGMSPRRAVLLGFSIPVFLVLFGSNQSFTELFMQFGKSLGSRTLIWTRSLQAISENLVLGNGVELGITTTMRIGINHCHNIVLQILYASGLIGILIVLLFVLVAIPTNRHLASSADYIILISIFVLQLASSFDWYVYMIPQYFLLALCINVGSSQLLLNDIDGMVNE